MQRTKETREGSNAGGAGEVTRIQGEVNGYKVTDKGSAHVHGRTEYGNAEDLSCGLR